MGLNQVSYLPGMESSKHGLHLYLNYGSVAYGAVLWGGGDDRSSEWGERWYHLNEADDGGRDTDSVILKCTVSTHYRRGRLRVVECPEKIVGSFQTRKLRSNCQRLRSYKEEENYMWEQRQTQRQRIIKRASQRSFFHLDRLKSIFRADITKKKGSHC